MKKNGNFTKKLSIFKNFLSESLDEFSDMVSILLLSIFHYIYIMEPIFFSNQTDRCKS